MDLSTLPLFTSLPSPLATFVCLSCDYLLEQMQLGSFPSNIALSLFLQNLPPFLSGGEQSAFPLILENLPESLQLRSSRGCCGLPRPYFQCAGPAGRLGQQHSPLFLSFACFLYSLTCSGGSLRFINVLYAAPRNLG